MARWCIASLRYLILQRSDASLYTLSSAYFATIRLFCKMFHRAGGGKIKIFFMLSKVGRHLPGERLYALGFCPGASLWRHFLSVDRLSAVCCTGPSRKRCTTACPDCHGAPIVHHLSCGAASSQLRMWYPVCATVRPNAKDLFGGDSVFPRRKQGAWHRLHDLKDQRDWPLMGAERCCGCAWAMGCNRSGDGGCRTAEPFVFQKIDYAADQVPGAVIAWLLTSEYWFLLERHGIGKVFIAACAQAWKGHCEEAAIRILFIELKRSRSG